MTDTVILFAAGSLKAALSDFAKAFELETGNKVEPKFGPSGLLKDEIIGGARAQVFASANMDHPLELHGKGLSGGVTRFARNTMCALVKPGLHISSLNLLEQMLDPNVKLATSTPKADPSGDYAFAVFAKAEAVRPGARGALEKKALQLTGAADSAVPPAGRNVYGWHVAEGHADIFLILHERTYCAEGVFRPAICYAAGCAGGRSRLRACCHEGRSGGSTGLRAIYPVETRPEHSGRVRLCAGLVPLGEHHETQRAQPAQGQDC